MTNEEIVQSMIANGWTGLLVREKAKHEVCQALDMARADEREQAKEPVLPGPVQFYKDDTRRFEAAKAAMQGIWAYQHAGGVSLQGDPNSIAELAVRSADALLAKLAENKA